MRRGSSSSRNATLMNGTMHSSSDRNRADARIAARMVASRCSRYWAGVTAAPNEARPTAVAGWKLSHHHLHGRGRDDRSQTGFPAQRPDWRADACDRARVGQHADRHQRCPSESELHADISASRCVGGCRGESRESFDGTPISGIGAVATICASCSMTRPAIRWHSSRLSVAPECIDSNVSVIAQRRMHSCDSVIVTPPDITPPLSEGGVSPAPTRQTPCEAPPNQHQGSVPRTEPFRPSSPQSEGNSQSAHVRVNATPRPSDD